ncbi:MAG: response regulator [Oceanospirillales bacterium]|uniref:Response regulator receiver domain-containing protein n=1 Tax=Marinobacterium halophilum TaxID=267374 RepID=A0A2P8F221_9GAMM|nr:response regulator [Marinobacterium halophilum]MBR9827637.1 response regulator [Oceanospirillales bacterium]PSL15763.1 response regulator receiver domain-containing protein [Marinobacterium halophilum]
MMITKPLSLLLVDDSRIARLSLKRQLQALGLEMSLLEADSADSAETLLQTATPDIALIDFNMPGRDGLQLAEGLKQSHPHMRMALVTANIQDALAKRAQALGMAFLPKPTTAEQLSAFIQQEK